MLFRSEQTGGGSTALRSYSGIWGIFQLLANEDHTTDPPYLFRLVSVRGVDKGSNPQPILPDGSPIILEVTGFPNGVQKAFDKDFFGVSCPGPKGIFE